MPWDKAKKTEGEVLKEYAISNGIPSEKILVTKDVDQENLFSQLFDNQYFIKYH